MSRTYSLVNGGAPHPATRKIIVGGLAGAGGDVHVFVGGEKVSHTIGGGDLVAATAAAVNVLVNALPDYTSSVVSSTTINVTRNDGSAFDIHLTTNEANTTFEIEGRAQKTALFYRAAAAAQPANNDDGVAASDREYITVTGLLHNPTAGTTTATLELWGMRPNGVWEAHPDLLKDVVVLGASLTCSAVTDTLAQRSWYGRNKGYERFGVKATIPAGCKFSAWLFANTKRDR